MFHGFKARTSIYFIPRSAFRVSLGCSDRNFRFGASIPLCLPAIDFSGHESRFHILVRDSSSNVILQ